jgi:hypothetical protein
VVLDESGEAIAGATVAKNREWNPKDRTRATGVKGEFAFHDAEPGEVIVTAQADGFAPITTTAQLKDEEVKLVLGLQRSVGLRGKLVDENGTPVVGAEVSPDQDQRYRKLYGWSTRTDSAGNFSWDSSPNEQTKLAIFAYGFGHTNATVQPGPEIQTITLNSSGGQNKRHVVTIRAIDKETKEPIQNATLHVEQHSGGGVSPFQGARESLGGVFQFNANAETHYVFEVRAQDYLPARTQMVKITEPQEIKVSLEKGRSIAGTILAPNGEPLAGASVALCTEEKGAILSSDRRLLFTDESLVKVTDSKGYFQHEPRVGAHSIYVVDQSGFAAVRLSRWQSAEPIRLKPWGRIEGVAKITGEIARGIELGLTAPNPNGNERWLNLYTFNTTTDSEGRFAFENVPPMEMKLCWMRPVSRGKHFSHGMVIDVQPGDTTEVIYAQSGGTVRGRLQFERNGDVDWATQVRSAHFGVKMESPSYDKYRDNPELLKRAYTEFWLSEEGRAWTRKQQSYGLELRKDGTFEIPAVPAGEYLLRVNVQEKSDRPFPPGKTIGTVEKAVVVPEASDNFDLGTVLIRKR